MTKISKTIVFFGSGPVALKSLEHLSSIFYIEAIITKPKKMQQKDTPPVEEFAKNNNLKVFFADNKEELENIFNHNKFSSELGVVIDYGVILDQNTIHKFKLGIVNSHFSLLPEWRGADPITFTVLSGQIKTGVSLMLIDSGLDTGKVITRKSLRINPDETGSSLTQKLINLSNHLLSSYLPLYLNGQIKPKKQPHPDRATYSRKINKSDGEIDWKKPASQIERQIRAFDLWPKSYTNLNNKRVIITKAHTTIASNSNPFDIKCGDGNYLVIDELIAPSGKKMSFKDFANGLKEIS